MRALALLYHDVVPAGRFDASGFCITGADRYKLTVEQFEQHLAAIAASSKHPPVRITDAQWQAFFLFTVDDGGGSALHIADRLQGRGWYGHFLVTTDYIGSPGFLREGEIRELRSRGHVIGSHSCSHPMPMWSRTPEELLAEWKNSRDRLEQILGETVTTASVPGGFYLRKIGEAAAKAGVKNLFTSEPTRAVHTVDGCRIIGRYGVVQTTPPSVAARLASGDPVACGKQQAFWTLKKLLKKVAPRSYAAARSHLLRPAAPAAADSRGLPKSGRQTPP